MSPLARQLRWLIGIRLVVITSILVPYGLLNLTTPEVAPEVPAAVQGSAEAPMGPPSGGSAVIPDETPPPGLRWSTFLRLAGLTYLASLLYILLFLLLPTRPAAQAYVQFIGDALLITALIYNSGGIASPFSIFYLVAIAVASTLLRRQAGFTVATVAYVLYAGLLIALFRGWLAPAGGLVTPEAGSLARVVYHLVVSFLGFYAVAFLTYYLAHQFSRTAAELVEKSEDLADLRVVYRDVIQSINTGLITTGLDGEVTSVNRAGEEILGQSAAALIGSELRDNPLFAGARWDELTAVVVAGDNQRSDAEIPRDDGIVFVGFTLSALTDAEGVQRGYILIFQDLTQFRALQEELRIKDRMAAVGELAAGLAHEIGNPLAAISGSVQMLASSHAGGDGGHKLLAILLKESQRLDRTIKGFLRFARPRERAATSFDVARLLAENFELLRNSEEVAPHHRLEIDLSPASASILADPDQVSQIFWNLAKNGLKAMPDGGTLRVVGRLDGNVYRLRVSDTGCGMETEERANLFHPFKSFFDSGSGIGMAIVYRIVEEHSGRVRVDSKPNRGTAIEVELPRGGAGGERREVAP